MSHKLDLMPAAQKKELWAAVKRDNPEMAQFITDMRAAFPGATAIYIKTQSVEAGEGPDTYECFPFVTADYDHKEAMAKWEATIVNPLAKPKPKKATKGRRK